MKIKICGITNLADAELSLELGADLLGFNFYRPSPRYIEPGAAAEVIASLPDGTVTVGIFVNEPTDAIAKLLEHCPLGFAQLHGDETPGQCREAAALGVGVIKAFRLREPDDIKQTAAYDVDAILLDAFHERFYGGAGCTFDWSWVRNARHAKVFLAGGITADNVAQAAAVGTYGLDLCSGVESKPGLKDHAKLRLLFERIAQAHD